MINRQALLEFISVRKRSFESIYKKFGYCKGRTSIVIRNLIKSGEIEAVQQYYKVGGLRIKLRIKEDKNE